MSGPTKSHGRLSISASNAPRDLMTRHATPQAWRARVLTLYPEMFPGPLGMSLTGKALKKGLWALEALDIRSFARDKHRTVDDTPIGGGPGMVLKPDIVAAAVEHARKGFDAPAFYLSPRGVPFTQDHARALSKGPGAILLCGRFEGVDQRVLDSHRIQEVSVGDFVMTGGEIPAMALIDAVIRLIPRVLGNPMSPESESFSNGLLEHPQYTKPADWNGRLAPEVLLSGHHAKIAAWRTDQAERLTKERRPDLWAAYTDRAGEAEQSVAQTSAAHSGNKDDQDEPA